MIIMSRLVKKDSSVVALFAFAGYDESELSFQAGQRITVLERDVHWCTGALPDGSIGAFPLALVVPADDARARAALERAAAARRRTADASSVAAANAAGAAQHGDAAAASAAEHAPCSRCGCGAFEPQLWNRDRCLGCFHARRLHGRASTPQPATRVAATPHTTHTTKPPRSKTPQSASGAPPLPVKRQSSYLEFVCWWLFGFVWFCLFF